MSTTTASSPTATQPPAPPPAGGSTGVVLPISVLLARRGSARSAVLVLPVVAFAATTTLLLVVLAGALSFLRWDDDYALTYQLLAALAVVLLVVPLASLGGAAARLSARRRDDRLATLRLLGATTATVARMTVLEAAAVALTGAVVGVVGYLLLAPFVQLIHFRGEPIGSAFWLAPWIVALAVAAVVLLAAVSAVVGLRQVSISPLGVRRRTDAPKVGWVRAAVGVVVIGVAAVAMQGSYADLAVLVAVVLGGFGAVLAVLNVLGPWVVAVLARRQLRRAQNPAQLLAARSMAQSPKAVWRQVSGVVMACFIAVVAGSGVATMAMTGDMGSRDDQLLVVDVQTGILVTLLASFLMVAASAGVTQAAEVLDRAELYRSLDRLGMPEATMVAAQRRTVMKPLVVITTISVAASGTLVLPLVGIAVVTAPVSVLVIVASIVGGVLLVRLGVTTSRTVLRSVLAEGRP
ncbi:FtsX-like permease family protein [Georgenia satyanarayanai]|uniref:FtsX-like permease family protein n=1 Tax=Georgenia satyanarayanai TaxID=860221 RepID=A0A2Y9A5B4_9MICO|nr:FtsX-like permease family protein [Georgenia satyanarayanai]PYG01176.1 FtsX-like permease family protein [Georgenia satyanarayanai]SSA39415.1 FtsX-like permease family protein [Georgenia satyanarayanai]